MSGNRPVSGTRREAALPATDVRAQFGQVAPGIVALEPRILLDAAALDTLHELAGPPETAGETAPGVDPGTLALVAALGDAADADGARIVFVDAGLADSAALMAEIEDGAEVHVLDAGADGVAQIAEILSGRADIAAIHILSHGEAGTLHLGNAALTAQSMRGEHADDLATIAAALSADADILIYGCDFAAGDAGQDALALLSAMTGADVAASEDLTGAAALGGDWELERTVGAIEAIALSADSYGHVLALGNTASWTVSGLSAAANVQGVTATIAFSSISPQSNVTGLANNAFTANTFFANGAEGDPSLAFVYSWDTTPEVAASVTLPDATGDGGTVTLTITFSQPVTDPIIHLDRLGGNMAFDPNTLVSGDEVSQSNSTLFTLTTLDATLTDLTVPTDAPHFEVTATTIQRTPYQNMVFSPSPEAGASGTNSTAAGSVRVNGTFTTITFVLSGVGVEGAGGDGIEIGLSLDAPPDARDDNFVVNEDATLTGNLFANNGAGADSDPAGDARTITQINGAVFTVGVPITLANGTLTITDATTGAFTFTPNPDDTAGQAFTYTIADANGGTDTANVSITVNAVNDNPVADDETVIAVPGQVTNIPVLVGDTDIDGGTLNVTHVNGTPVSVGTPLTLPSGTQVTLLGDGTLDVVMAPGSSGAESFTYTVSDGNGGADNATVTLNRDSDGDGVVDATDIDDDNDGILDTAESGPGASGANPDPDMSTLLGGGTATIAGVDVTVTTTGTVNSFGGDAFLAAGAHVNPGFGVTTTSITYTFSQPISSFTTTFEAQQDEEQITFSQAASSVTNVLNSTYGVAPSIMSQATLENGGLELRSNLTDAIGSNTSASFGSNSIVTWNFATPVTTLTITHTGVDRGNGATNYNGSIIGGAFVIATATAEIDTDGDGFVDRLDIDSDNDGITDNVEAQTTAGYVAPSGIDSDGNGLDDAYESAPGAGEGLTPVDTDGDATADLRDADSDNDGTHDIAERGDGQPNSLTSMTDTDGDGLLDIFEGSNIDDGFDVNDENRTATTLNLAGVPALAADGSNAVPLATDLLFRDVNDPPVGVDDSIPVTEDTPVTQNVLGNDTDIDGDPLTISSAAIDLNGDGTPDPLALDTPTAMVTTTGAAIGIITVGANGDVTFVPAQDYNGPIPDLTYVPNDGTADGTAATVTFGPLAPVNDPPVLDLDPDNSAGGPDDGGFETTFTENGPGVAIVDTDLVIGDPEDDIVEIVITLTNGLVGDMFDFPSVLPGGVTASVVPVATLTAPGVMTLTLTGTLATTSADWNAILQSVRFAPSTNDVHNPDVADRVITIAATDATMASSPVLETVVHVVAVNDPPTLDLDDDNSSGLNAGNYQGVWVENDPGAPISSGVVITDLDDTNLESLTITLTNGEAGDLLAIGALPPGIVLAGPPPGPLAAPGTITVTLSGTASLADYQAAVAAITFANNSEDPVAGTRAISASGHDGESSTPTRTAFITVQPVNDAPYAQDPGNPGVPADAMPAQVGVDGALLAPFDAGPYFADPDNLPSELVFGLDPLTTPAWLSIDPLTGIISGTPSAGASQLSNIATPGVYEVTVIATDPGGLEARTTLTYTIANPPPVAADDALAMLEGSGPASGSVLADNGNGPDSDPDGDTLVVTAVNGDALNLGLPVAGDNGGLFTLNGDGTFAFVEDGDFEALAPGETRTTSVTYTISDGQGGFDTATFAVTVTGTNDAPIPIDPTRPPVADPTDPSGPPVDPDDPRAPPLDPSDYIPAQAGDDGAPLTPFDLSPYFGDPDGSETPVLSIDPGDLPPGLVFDPLTNLVSGTPSANASQGGDPLNPGTYTVPVTATDPSGATFTTNLTIVISNSAPDARDDMLAADEDGPVFGSVFDDNGDGPDTDPDGDTIIVSAVGADPLNVGQPVAGSAGGTFTIDANGDYTFDPGADFNGLAVGEQAATTIAYQISDGQGGLDTALVTVIVHGVNDAPVVVDPLVSQPDPANPVPAADPSSVIPAQLATDGEDFTTLPLVDVSTYVMDPDASDTLAFSTTDPLPAGLVLNPDGTVTGIVDPSASLGGDPLDPGIYVVNITVDDGHGGVAVVPLTIDVSNLAPVAVDDHASGNEDSAQSGNVITDPATGDSDALPDADPVTVIEAGGVPVVPGVPTVLPLAHGTLTLAEDGSWSFLPNGLANTLGDGDTATETVTYTIADGQGGTATATLSIDITGVNDPVQVVDPSDPQTDPSDPSYDPVNPPVIADPDNLIPDVLANDGDTIAPVPAGNWFGDAESDVLTFSATGLPPGLAIDPATGEIAGTLDPDASQGGDPLVPGTYLVTVVATDPQGNTASTTVTFTVSNLPPVARDDAFSATEDAPVSGSVLHDNGNGADADGAPDNDPLTVSAVAGGPAGVGQPVEGDNGGVFIVNPDGTFSFDPGNDFQSLAVGQTATTSIAYEVSDGNGGFATATVTVTVAGVNDAPIPVDLSQPAIGDPTDPLAPPTDPDDPRAPPTDPLDYLPHLAGEDGDTIAPFDLTPWFGDPDAADTLVLSLDPAALPTGLVFDPATGIVSGTLDHSASQGGDPLNPGVHVIAVTATDPSGATFVTNLTFTVSNPPPIAVDDAVTASEDAPLVGSVLVDNGLGVDADASPDSDPVHVVAVDGLPGNVGLPASGTGGGTFTIAADGSFVFDPGIDFQDLDVGETRTTTITYTISDGEGGNATATVTVTVEGANDGPVVIDPTDPGDPRDPNPPADPLDVIADQLAHDGEPIAPLDVSAYFFDVDVEPLTFAIDPAGAPSWLVIDPATGLLTGTPPADASQGGPGGNGIYTVTITATDPDGAIAATSVDIIVSNLPPLAVDDAASASEDVVQSGNVLTDPLTGDADTPPDADPLVVTSVGGIPVLPGSPVTLALTHGTLVLAADGSWTFAPNGVANTLGEGENAVETVTYEIADGNGGFASATLAITVEGVNDPVQVVDPHDPETDPGDPSYDPTHPPLVDPSLLAGPLGGADGTPFEPFAAAPFFGDAEGDTITYSATGLPAGLTIDPLTGVISGTPASDASVHGPYSVTVIATDPQGNVAALPVEITITNPAPVAIDAIADQETFASTPDVIDTGQAFDDPDGDTLTFTATGLPDGMTIDPATGRISGTPAPGSFLGGPGGDGLHSVTVTADDGQGGSTSVTFLYQIRPLPYAAPVVAQPDGPPSGPPGAFDPPAPGVPILTATLHAIRALGGHVGIGDALHPVTQAVGEIAKLGAPVGLDPHHPIDDVVRWIEQARVPAGAIDDGRISGGFESAPWLGHDEPIGFGEGESRAHARIVLWQGRTWLELLSRPGANMSWSFRGADGSALPSFAMEVSGNLLAIARPADRTWLAIAVHGESASGAVVDQQLSIDLARGRIVLGGGPQEHAAAGLTFEQQAGALIGQRSAATLELLAALGG
ncbi:MAG: Ig-like domain-containing protein [Rhizobiaceae bacterium]